MVAALLKSLSSLHRCSYRKVAKGYDIAISVLVGKLQRLEGYDIVVEVSLQVCFLVVGIPLLHVFALLCGQVFSSVNQNLNYPLLSFAAR